MQFLVQFAAEELEGIDALGLDLIAMLLQAGSFLLIFVIVRKYMLEKIVSSLESRRTKISESLKNVDEIEKQREKVAKESETTLKSAREEADKIIAQGHEEAGSIVAQAETKAEKRASEILSGAEAKTQQQVEQARTELKNELLELVSDATATVLDEKVDSAKDQALIRDALQKGVQG